MTIVQLQPADREPPMVITKDVFFRAAHLLSPDVDDDRIEWAWQKFHAMKCRVKYPRRRRGPYCWRIPESLALVPDPLPFEGEDVGP